MRRAAVLIGVDRTGTLPELNDAAAGAERMARWAEAQGMAVALLTDKDGGEVTARQVKDAVKKFLLDGIGQLLVYFAGHGINRNRGEYWLLTGAPDDPQEAVNLSGSEDLARTSGFAHVVFISDACRTAADTILAGSVTGSEIFPNADRPEIPVDQFFACRIGMPANEVKDVAVSSASFKALYTGELLPALEGKVAKVLDWGEEQGRRRGFVRSNALGDYLKEAMLAKLGQPQFAGRIIQEPSDRILSRPPIWISAVDADMPGVVAPPPAPPGAPMPRIDAGEMDVHRGPAPFEPPLPPGKLVERSIARRFGNSAAQRVATAGRAAAEPFGPMAQESRCGFKLRGAKFIGAVTLGPRMEMTTIPGDVVRIWNPPPKGTPVLLLLDGGSGAVLPAIPEYLASLTVENGDLVDVAYEPSEHTWRWDEFKHQADELRALRGIASAATRSGVFRLEGEGAASFARRMQMMKLIDPSLAVYAAYAYNDLQDHAHLKEMDQFMRDVMGGSLFDVALLARTLKAPKAGEALTMRGFAPLLSQGWAYLSGRGIKLPAGLEALPGTLHDSLWTLFNPEGVKILRAQLFKGVPP